VGAPSAVPAPGSVERLVAVEEIRQAALRYCRGLDRLDVDTMRSAYHPDATDDHGVFVGNAWELCRRVVDSHRAFDATMHCVLNHAIDLDDASSARGELYVLAQVLRTAEDGTQVLDSWNGRYADRYTCRDGRWAIAHRLCVHEWTRSEPVRERMHLVAGRFAQGREARGTGALLGPAAFPGRPVPPGGGPR
jgi:hypothetical protein